MTKYSVDFYYLIDKFRGGASQFLPVPVLCNFKFQGGYYTKLAKTGKNWQKLAITGKNWQKLAKTKNC